MSDFVHSHRCRVWSIVMAAWCLLLCTIVWAQDVEPLRTGWHDELNPTAVHDWI